MFNYLHLFNDLFSHFKSASLCFCVFMKKEKCKMYSRQMKTSLPNRPHAFTVGVGLALDQKVIMLNTVNHKNVKFYF